MKIALESTERIVDVEIGAGPIPGRVWEGTTETGIPVAVVVTRIAVHKDADLSQFRAELAECRPPSAMAIEAIPLRLIL